MALTRAQYIQGDSSQGRVLEGQVQGVKQGAGISIAADGTISFYAPTSTGVVKLNNPSAYNSYVWPNVKGDEGTFLGVSPGGGLAWLPPPGLVFLGDAPANPKLGQLWFSYDTNLTYVYQDRGSNLSWYPVYRGLEPQATLCSSNPEFPYGTGSEADPFSTASVTSRSGNTVLFPSTITITGLAPFQYTPIIDVNAEGNDYRFQVTNTFADITGTLTFKVKFTDFPQTTPGTAYTAKFRVGFDYPIFIESSIGITTPVAIQNAGSISGIPIVGEELNYTVGNAVGGTPPYNYTWEWRLESGNTVLQTNGDSYIVGSEASGSRVFVKLTATDTALDQASGNTASFPAAPSFITKSPFPLTDILYPTTPSGTATTLWLDPGTTLRARNCIEFSADGVVFGQGPTVIGNGGSITTRWINSSSCSGANNNTTIFGCIYSNSYEDCSSLLIDRVPSPFAFLPVYNVNLGALATSQVITPIGYNSTAYVTYSGSSTGTNIQASLDEGDNWFDIPLAGDTTFPINPGETLRVRMTVGSSYSSDYTATINIGSDSVFQSTNFVAVTLASSSFTTAIAFPTITTQEIASPAWVDGSTSLSATGCIQFKVGSGGTWKTVGDSPTAVVNGNILYTRWSGASPGVCGNAVHGTVITGTITNTPSGGTKVSNASLTLDRVPAGYSFVSQSGQANSSVITSNTININGTNAPAFLTFGATSTLTSLQASVGGGAWVSIPSSGETLSIAPTSSGPGTTLQIRGTTGSTVGQTYTAVINIGQSSSIQATTWSVGTSALVPSVATPSIVLPTNGATNLTPPIVVTSSAYTPLNGASSTHASTNWQVRVGSTSGILILDVNSTTQKTSYTLTENIFASFTYFVRCQYVSGSGSPISSAFSPWSQFSTALSFGSISNPSIVTPANGTSNIDPYSLPGSTGITITSSSYIPNFGAGPHASTNWEVRKDSTTGAIVVNTNSSTQKTSYLAPAAIFETSKTYYARCQYISSDATPIISNWSAWSQFSTSSSFLFRYSWIFRLATPSSGFLTQLLCTSSGSQFYGLISGWEEPHGPPPAPRGAVSFQLVRATPTGISWSSSAIVPMPYYMIPYDMTEGNGKITAACYTNDPINAAYLTQFATTTNNGASWTLSQNYNMGLSGTLFDSIACNGSVWVSASSGDGRYMLRSTNPTGSWATQTTPFLGLNPSSSGSEITSVKWFDNRFVAVGSKYEGSVITNYIFTSVDGISWATIGPVNVPTNIALNKIFKITTGGGSPTTYYVVTIRESYGASDAVPYYYCDGGFANWTLGPSLGTSSNNRNFVINVSTLVASGLTTIAMSTGALNVYSARLDTFPTTMYLNTLPAGNGGGLYLASSGTTVVCSGFSGISSTNANVAP